MIPRTIYQNIESFLYKGKVIVLLGPRQVGKTTLMKALLDKNQNSQWLNADEGDIKQVLQNATTSTQLRNIIGADASLVVIDEAQQIEHIGHKVKLLFDTYPDLQIILSGSSSLDLHDALDEPHG